MGQQFNEELADRIDKAAENYWLQGYHIGYAKRRAAVEMTRPEMPQRTSAYPVVRL